MSKDSKCPVHNRVHSCDVLIVGAGVVGCSIARELSRFQLDILVADAGSDVARETSRANSGIAHAGFDARHGTLKAKYNVLGSQMIPALSQELGFHFKNNGSMVLAFTPEEEESVRALLENGTKNGVAGLRLLSAEEAYELEPELAEGARCALFAPTGGIVDPYGMTLAFAENAVENGARFLLNTRICSIVPAGCGNAPADEDAAFAGDGFLVQATDLATGEAFAISAKAIVNAAGCNSGDIAAMLCGDAGFRIIPRRGEYVLLDKRCGGHVSHTVFRAPSAAGKGVLISPTVDGNVIVGPNAHQVDFGDTSTTAEGIDEVLGKARSLWPDLPESGVITKFAGVRSTPDTGDFVIGPVEGVPGFFNAAGIESPGLSAAPAIAVDVAAICADYLDVELKTDFAASRKQAVRFTELSDAERAAHIASDSAWGRLVCRCEQVTEAEIVAAIHGPIPADTLDAIKWRTRAGMGRCHGGFCSPMVAELIARETGCGLDEVCKGNCGSLVGIPQGSRKSGPIGKPAVAPDGTNAADSVPSQGTAPEELHVDVAVIGGGAAGIAAALAAEAAGIDDVLLLDREKELGGILKQCIHPGFGLERYKEELTGPEYAARDIADLQASGVEVLGETTVYRLEAEASGSEKPSYLLSAVGPAGLYRFHAGAVVLATGSRERSIGQIGLTGDRPAGAYTAGCAQNFVNLQGLQVGKRVVIQGSGDIGLIMARRMAWEGAEVIGVTERTSAAKGLQRNVAQCLEDNGIPLLSCHTVSRVIGHDRVAAVELMETDPITKEPLPGTEQIVPCDTFLASVGLIPERDLLDDAGIFCDRSGECGSEAPGVFTCGNAAFIHDIVDGVTVDGTRAGRRAAAFVLGQGEPEETEHAASQGAHGSAPKVDLAEGEKLIICTCCPQGCAMVARMVADADAALADVLALDPAVTNPLTGEQIHLSQERKPAFRFSQGCMVMGNRCKRGLAFAVEEMTAPKRVLTTTVRRSDGLEPVSVRTAEPILKSAIPACLAVLEQTVVSGSVAVGDVVVFDICGTGVDIVATKGFQ